MKKLNTIIVTGFIAGALITPMLPTAADANSKGNHGKQSDYRNHHDRRDFRHVPPRRSS